MADDLTRLVELEAQLKALDDSMHSGVLRAEDADTGRLDYRPYSDMQRARADLVARIGEIMARLYPAAPRPARQYVMTGRSGW